MEFSWMLPSILWAIVFIEGLGAWMNKTFSVRQSQKRKYPVKLCFLNHWGIIIGDIVLIPLFAGIAISFLTLFPIWVWALFGGVASAVTLPAHKWFWHLAGRAPNLFFPDREMSKGNVKLWYKDFSFAGIVHYVYAAISEVFIFAYIFSPVPQEIVLKVGIIFLVFALLIVIQPGIAEEGWPIPRWKKWMMLRDVAVLWVFIALVTWLKLIHWWIL